MNAAQYKDKDKDKEALRYDNAGTVAIIWICDDGDFGRESLSDQMRYHVSRMQIGRRKTIDGCRENWRVRNADD